MAPYVLLLYFLSIQSKFPEIVWFKKAIFIYMVTNLSTLTPWHFPALSCILMILNYFPSLLFFFHVLYFPISRFLNTWLSPQVDFCYPRFGTSAHIVTSSHSQFFSHCGPFHIIMILTTTLWEPCQYICWFKLDTLESS